MIMERRKRKKGANKAGNARTAGNGVSPSGAGVAKKKSLPLSEVFRKSIAPHPDDKETNFTSVPAPRSAQDVESVVLAAVRKSATASKANVGCEPSRVPVVLSHTLDSNWKRLLQEKPEEVVPKKRKRKRSSERGAEERRVKKRRRDESQDVSSHESTSNEGAKGIVVAAVNDEANDEADNRPTRIVAMNCKRIGAGQNGQESLLARVCIVNSFGGVVLDTHVAPQEPVTNYRTAVSGIRPEDLVGAPSFEEVQEKVAKVLKGRTVVGHGVRNDLKVLYLSHPKAAIRDTACYRSFRDAMGKPKSLRELAYEHLGKEIQSGEHHPGEDARSALELYKKFKKEWEASLKYNRKRGARRGGPRRAGSGAGDRRSRSRAISEFDDGE